MSSPRSGARADDSKGPRPPRAGVAGRRRASAAAGLSGAAATLLAAATPVIAVRGAGADGWERHGAALPLLAAAAIVLLLVALRGAVAAAAGLTGVGVVVLALALVGDLPHVHDTGSVGDIAHLERAHPGTGYYLETAGGVLLLLAGGLLLLGGDPTRNGDLVRGDQRRDEEAPGDGGAEPPAEGRSAEDERQARRAARAQRRA